MNLKWFIRLDDKKKTLWILGVFLIMMMPQICQGVTMNNTRMVAEDNNYDVNTNNTILFDQLRVNSSDIIFSNLTNTSVFKNNDGVNVAKIYLEGMETTLIYHDNLSVFCADVLGCSGTQIPQWGINEFIFVLNKYVMNSTEVREFNPIWYSVDNDTEKHIISNLTETINATSLWKADNCSIYSANYTSNTSAYGYSLNETNATLFFCNGDGHVQMNISGVEPGTNYIGLFYGFDLDELWQFSIMFGFFGIGGLFAYLGKKLDDDNEPIKRLLFLTSLLMGLVGVYVLIPMASPNDTGVADLLKRAYQGTIFVFLTVSSFYIIFIAIKIMDLLKRPVGEKNE